MDIRNKYPMLDNLFGAYFHQDWNDYYESPEAIISAFAKNGGKKDIEDIISEIKLLLNEEHTQQEWYRLILDDFGCEYSLRLRNIDPKEWLKKIQKQFEDELVIAEEKQKQ